MLSNKKRLPYEGPLFKSMRNLKERLTYFFSIDLGHISTRGSSKFKPSFDSCLTYTTPVLADNDLSQANPGQYQLVRQYPAR